VSIKSELEGVEESTNVVELVNAWWLTEVNEVTRRGGMVTWFGKGKEGEREREWMLVEKCREWLSRDYGN
jgi:hypothetical protein